MSEKARAKGQQPGLPLTATDFASLAAARSGMYDFLAGLCTKPTAKEIDAILRHPIDLPGDIVPESLRKSLEAFQACFSEVSKEGTEQSLQVDWTRLFRGVAKGYSPLPPYESVYKEGLLQGPTAKSVARLYATNGVGLPNTSKELPDYIGVEFKFMSTLASKEAEAWCADASKAEQLIEGQLLFAREHLQAWVPRFCDEAQKFARTDFYRAAIQVIRSISEWDSILLDALEETVSNASWVKDR